MKDAYITMRILIDARYQPAPDALITTFIAAAGDLDIHVWLPASHPQTAWRALLPPRHLHRAPGPTLDAGTHATWTTAAVELLEASALLDLAPDLVWTPGAAMAVDRIAPPPPLADLPWLVTAPPVPAPAPDLHAQTQQRPLLARYWQWLKGVNAVWVDEAVHADVLADALLLSPTAVRCFSAAMPAARANELLQALPALTRGDAHPARADARPSLAFVSPLPPERSGIADYSAELLPELARHYRITLVNATPATTDPWLNANFPSIDLPTFRARARQFDRIVYQLGNSHFHAHQPELIAAYPGVVVLHDFFLGHLHGWRQIGTNEPFALLQALHAAHGWPALRHLADHGQAATLWHFPANGAQIAAATGVIVHSEHAMRLAQTWLPAGLAGRLQRVAQLRRPPPALDRARARAALGLSADAFTVCSFGFLGPSKRNDDLLNAWLDSHSSRDPRCQLVFVGQNPGGDHGEALQRRLRELPPGVQVRITGFVTPDDYAHWLTAADLAVQLRTLDRGETSRGVLDCLAYGLPLIANAHGSMADLPADVVHLLPDDFTVAQLHDALDTLRLNPDRRTQMSRDGRAYIRQQHHPVAVAAAYRDVIEHTARQSPLARHRQLIRRLGRLLPAPAPAELDALLEPLSRLLPANGPGRWFVDITALRQSTHVTGIERVTRALLLALLEDPRVAARIVPVQATPEGYRQAWDHLLERQGLNPHALPAEPILPRAGDLFLGLDWAPTAILQHRTQLAGWRAQGVRLWFLIHDVLPATHPHWFPPHLPPLVQRWLGALAELADGCVCVSAATATELADWWQSQGVVQPPALKFSHHGADFAPPAPSSPTLDPLLEQALAARPSLLMVGTIEPRKGHAQAFAAFERLWSAGVDLNLIVIGRPGWPNDTATARRPIVERVQWLETHPEREQRLFWPREVDDAMLAALYQRASALLAVAEGEGFGLPLIEAAHHGLPLIARDIPVFREIAGAHAWYVDDAPDPTGSMLASALRAWLKAREAGQIPASQGLAALTWSQSAERLRDILLAAVDA